MTCPNWQALVGGGSDRESEAWLSALGHLDQCSECRPGALAADPLLAFRRLPAAELEETEVEDLRARVQMARRVQRAAESGRRVPRWREAVAAAVLFIAVGWVGGNPEPMEWSGTMSQATAGSISAGSSSVGSIPARSNLDVLAPSFSFQETASLHNLDGASMPLFEEIGEPYQQVVQWSDENLSVVLVVDDRFDV